MKASYNDKLIVTPYQLQGLKSEVSNGIARVVQKSTLVPLTLLVEAKLNSGEYIPVGSKVFFDEEFLTLSPSTKRVKHATFSELPFIVMELKDVVAIEVEDIVDLSQKQPA